MLEIQNVIYHSSMSIFFHDTFILNLYIELILIVILLVIVSSRRDRFSSSRFIDPYSQLKMEYPGQIMLILW